MADDGFSDVADVTDEGYDFAPDPSGSYFSDDVATNNASNYDNYDYGGSTTPGTATITNTGTDMFGGGGAGDFGLGFNPNAGKGIEGIDPTYQSNFQSKNLLNDQMANYYTKMRGATDTNPYPDSFFSRMLGVDNVNYTNILGGKEGVKRVNDLRARQAFGLPTLGSMKIAEDTDDTSQLKNYQAGDYYIGQPTNMGEVKPIQESSLGISSLINMLPGGAALSAMMPQKGLPENDPRYRAIMEEQARSANEPSILSGIVNTGKNIFTGAKNLFTGAFSFPPPSSSLVTSPVENVKKEILPTKFDVPVKTVFDAFGTTEAERADTREEEPIIDIKSLAELAEERKKLNEQLYGGSDNRTNFQNKPKYEQQADLSQTFKNIGNEMGQYMGADGKKIGEGNLRFYPSIEEDNNFRLQYNLPISKYLDRAFG